jgi:hypothetical protein
MRRVSLSVPVDPGPMGLDLGKGGNGKVEPSLCACSRRCGVFTFFVFACGYGFVYELCVWALCMG